MAKTRHIQKRLSQRSIKERVLDLVQVFGIRKGDKIILNRKACDAVDQEMKKMQQELRKARSRGGFVLIEDSGSLITIYALNSFNRGAASNDTEYEIRPSDS